MRLLSPLWFAPLLALLLSGAGLAAGYAVPNTNPRDLAMAGSAVANQTGAEAAYGNGAALAGLQGLSLSLGAGLVSFRSTWTDTADARNGSVSTNASPALPPSFAAAYGGTFQSVPWGAGLAFNVPGGGQVRWPAGWPGRGQVVSISRRIYAFDLVGAAQPIPQLKVGLGVTWAIGTEQLEQAIVLGASDALAKVNSSGSKLSYTVALEARPLRDRPLKLGLQYRHKADLALSGDAHFENVPAALSALLLDQGVRHPVSFPNVLHLGAAYEPLPGLSIQAALTFWRFIVWKAESYAGDKGFAQSVRIDSTNAMTYRLGAEVGGLLPRLQIRAGLARDVSPQRTRTVNPGLPESSRWAFSVGAGYEVLPGWTVNGALEQAVFDPIAASGQLTFPGSYETAATVASLGVSWKLR